MKIRNTVLALMCAATIAASGVPARRGVVRMVPQPDGSVVNLQLVGDEHGHYYLTTDNKVVVSRDNAYYYATVDAHDNFVVSDVLVHNPSLRSDAESRFAEVIDGDRTKAVFHRRAADMARSNNQEGKGSINTTYPTTGVVKSLVLLVEYSDVPFVTQNAGEYFTRLLNEEGFSENGAKGSARDYYVAASKGQFIPEFDVYGPVTLPNDRAYYGGNNSWGQDKRPKEMLLHAGRLLDDSVDFSQYDLDGDKFVDNVYIFYAGRGENEGSETENLADCVWPHQTSVGVNPFYRFDGVQLNRYACSGEIARNKPDGIGTFCHEFAHVLGLPDLYNIQDKDAIYTPLDWSVMDNGCYNEDGNQPPSLSAYERNVLGWISDGLTEITGPASCTLEPLEDSNRAYMVNTDRPDEYFIFENRQNQGWDSSLPGHGLLVWHIDYDRSAFSNNLVNANPDHQRVDIVEAVKPTKATRMQQRLYTFGTTTGKKYSFTYDTTPSFQSWTGTDLGLPLTEIKEKSKVVTFLVAGGGDDPASIGSVTVESAMQCSVSARTIEVEARGRIVVSDLSGRVIAQGTDSLKAEAPAPGVYIVATATASRKVLVR